MKCIVLTKYGNIAALVMDQRPDLIPQADQLLIDVKAAGLNFGDVLIRQGLHKESPRPPAVHGMEVSGVVKEIGAALADRKLFNVGDRVLAFLPNYGGFSDQVVCGPEYVHALPESCSFIEGAAFPISFLTAYVMTSKIAHVVPDDEVLIHSAGGAMGLALLQFCTLYKAKIFCTASPVKHDRLKALGALECLSYNDDLNHFARSHTTEGGFDVIFDALGESFRKSYQLLAPLGRLSIYGANSFVAGPRVNFIRALINLLKFPIFWPLLMMHASKTVAGFGILRIPPTNHKLQKAFGEVVQLFHQGKLKPRVDKTFPLEQIGEAQTYLEQRKNFGKVVLTL